MAAFIHPSRPRQKARLLRVARVAGRAGPSTRTWSASRSSTAAAGPADSLVTGPLENRHNMAPVCTENIHQPNSVSFRLRSPPLVDVRIDADRAASPTSYRAASRSTVLRVVSRVGG